MEGWGCWPVAKPGRFSAFSRAAIGPLHTGSCFGPTRRAEVAAQALKGRRAGPTLSTIGRA
jgi:hypothetical protein